MSSKGHEHGSGNVARMVTPPPASASSNEESSMRNPAARRHHHTTAHQSSPYPSRIQIKLDAPLSLLGSLNVADNESSITTTTISLGRSLHTSGIFRAPAANTVSANDNNNVAGGGTSAAAGGAAAGGGGGSTSTTPTSAIDDDELYAFLKLPGLSHDTMENDTDDEDDNTLVRGPTPPKHL